MIAHVTVIRQLPWHQQPADVRAFRHHVPVQEHVTFILTDEAGQGTTSILISPEGQRFRPGDLIPLTGWSTAAMVVIDAVMQGRMTADPAHRAICRQFAGEQWTRILGEE